MDRAQSRAGRTHPERDDRRRRPRPGVGGPAGDRGAIGRGARAAGDHDPGRCEAVAGDDRGDGPDRSPQEPLANAGALDHRRNLYRDFVRGPATLIAMHAIYDIIDILILEYAIWPA